MKKSTKAVKSVMSGGMFMNSSSSNESHSDEDKCHLPTADSILSDNEKHHQENRLVIRRTLSRLKRQQATTSLQTPLSIRKTSSLESIDDDDDHDNNDVIMSDEINLNDNQQTEENLHRTSFNESERTDSGIGRDGGSSWRLSSYCDSFHHHHPTEQLNKTAREQEQQLDKQQEESEHDEFEFDSPVRPQLNPICHESDDFIEKNKLQKAGWLHTKHWLTVQRHQKIDLASKRQWKRYWTCLKGSTLFFYNDYSDTNSKFSLSIVESLCYPLPEHPHRQHVFSLTTRLGETFCFQASDQSELDHWIRKIHFHSSTKINEFQLKNFLSQIEENIERENKMRKLADLQLKSSASQKVRLLISKQIDLWEKNLEGYQVDLFRHKCYLCALTNDRELPNPKDLLAQASPSTKASLHKLGAFTPCSFYSCVAARRRSDRSIVKVKSEPKTSNDDQTVKNETKCYLTTPSSPILADETILQLVTTDSNPQTKTIVSISQSATVDELLKRVTEKLNLQIDDHFLYFDGSTPSPFIPNRNVKLNQLNYSSVEIRRKAIYQLTLYDELQSSGIEIETELHREYSLRVIVSNVRKESEAERLGIRSGDEIVMIHDVIVQDLDLNALDNCLSQIPILLTIRSSRSIESADQMRRSLDLSQSIIQNLICPPPPRRVERLSRQEIRDLVVPKPESICPNETKTKTKTKTDESKETRLADPSGSALERLFKNVDELSRYCRPTTNLCQNENESIATTNPTPRIKALSNAQRIRKVIFELVETERTYVQDMQRLLERYIEPLRDDSKLLPSDVIESLYVSVKSIHQLQMTFLERLESNVPTQILAYNAVHEFREILIGIGETFLSYSQYFKLYSTFCAMHLRINRLLDIHQNNQHLKDFLAARNPRHQHSSSFESYLIKPVQRILKYPLLLQQILNFANVQIETADSTTEIVKLKKAITMMNEIGEYMNAMQQLYEDFGQSFEQITKTYSEERNQNLLLNLPDLYAYGEIDWINIHQFLLRKNYHRLKSYCFVFRHGCLILTREQVNKKKQDLLSIHKGPKILVDRFIRFIPIEELNVEFVENDLSKDNICTWQLIETDAKTRLKTNFRFANKEAQTFVNTIQNCISSSVTTVEWRTSPAERSNVNIRNSDPSHSSQNSIHEQRLASSRSCHVLLPSNGFTPLPQAETPRSPSPVWKRRTTPVRKQPLSMNIRRKTMKNSTDC